MLTISSTTACARLNPIGSLIVENNNEVNKMNVSCTIILKINATEDKEFVLNEIFLSSA